MQAIGALPAAGGLLLLCLAGVAQAQVGGSGPDAGSPGVAYIEEIIVTARIRAEPLQDVPISVSVISDEWVLKNSVRTFEELSYSVPNFTVNETPIDTNVFIRGIGSPENQGFEQSVGLFSDGVYWGRARQARAPFFDVERIEILKGPQGILFGKNTSAGAVNIATAKPTSLAEGRASVYFEPDASEIVAEGVLSGPLGDKLRGRIAVRSASMDGWIRNTAIGADEPGRDELLVRGTLTWDASDVVDMTLKYEHGSLDVDGTPMQISDAGPFAGLFSLFDPEFEDALDEQRSIGGSGVFIEPEKSDTDTRNAAFTVNWRLGEYELTAITGYSAYEFSDVFDADISALSQAQKLFSSDFEQISQEVRLLSPPAATGGFDFIVGFYWQDGELDVETRDDIDLAVLSAPAGSRYYVTNQSNRLWALFAQATWRPTDTVRITGGLRWADEDKDAARSLVITNLGTTTPNPALEPFFAGALGTFPHMLSGSRSETQLLPSINLQWDAMDFAMLYASYSKGFKGGGFDEQLTSGNRDDWEFEEEEVDAYELGVKLTLREGSATLNAAIFRNEYDDLQVSAFDGLAGFVVGNAAEATSQGLEVDARFRISPAFQVGGSLALLDAEYDRFENANCTAQQTFEHETAGNPPPCLQDLSGREPLYSPKWAGNVFGEFFTEVGALELRTTLEANFSDSFFITQDLDSNLEQDSFTKLNFRLGLATPDHGWEIALIAKNITDEKTASFGNDVPILSGAFFKFLDRPRTVAVQGTLRF